MSSDLETKLAKALVNREKKLVNEELNIYKIPQKNNKDPKQIKDEAFQKALEISSSVPPENRAIYLKEIEKLAARENYVDYLTYVHKDYMLTKFHHFLASIIDGAIKRVERGESVRILLSVPPRHGKSYTLTETAASWFVGRNPDSMAVITAYGSELAESFGDKNRQLAKRYWKPLFGVDIAQSQDNKGLFAVNKRRGGVLSTGITAGITGHTGRFQLIILDDPYKNGMEATNPTIRNNIESTARDSVFTRADGRGCAIIIIHTRWHDEDLIGVLKKEDGWVYINIPALADYNDPLDRKFGEPLCPELGFDENWANNTRLAVGLRNWNALYMGKPSVDGGNIFQRDMFKFYKKNELPFVFEEVSQTWDLSLEDKKSSDFVAGQVWGRIGANHYLLNRIKRRLSFMQTIATIKEVCNKYPETKRIFIEKRASGSNVIEVLSREISGIIPVIPKDSKVQRASAVLPFFDAGNVYIPDEKLDTTIDDYVDEFLKFPNGAHDDQVDATTQYFNEIQRVRGGKVNVDDKYAKISRALRGLKI